MDDRPPSPIPRPVSTSHYMKSQHTPLCRLCTVAPTFAQENTEVPSEMMKSWIMGDDVVPRVLKML